MTSLKSTRDILLGPFSLPTNANWDNYATAWDSAGFGQATLTTLIFVGSTLVIVMVISVPAAYGLARRMDRTASSLTTYFAMGLALPMQTVLIPYFVINNGVSQFMTDWITGWWDPRIGLVVFYSSTAIPWTVFVLTSFFRSLPASLEEAAQLDGAGPWLTFRKIMLPIARGPVTTVAIITAIGAWNETLLVLFLVPDGAQRTLPAALLNMYYGLQYTSNWGALFAGIVILIGPIIVAFLWLGRRVIEGATLGANK
ncbi:carbohydrate ABC transporter permease [Arthrobacter sp. RCC_34]|uniref:carbohydrate ABC transporter permease n=1 Tax=Arthrobacter sp. RCC_34 TaxID=3239230 RepID=UPI003525EF4A